MSPQYHTRNNDTIPFLDTIVSSWRFSSWRWNRSRDSNPMLFPRSTSPCISRKRFWCAPTLRQLASCVDHLTGDILKRMNSFHDIWNRDIKVAFYRVETLKLLTYGVEIIFLSDQLRYLTDSWSIWMSIWRYLSFERVFLVMVRWKQTPRIHVY